MLVLTRKLREKIVFPAINATVQVVEVNPGSVRLGIDAPLDVEVLRDELVGRAEMGDSGGAPITDCTIRPTLYQLNQLLRDWLDIATISLALLRRQMRVGLTEATLVPFDRAIGRMRKQMQLMGRLRLPNSQVLLVEDRQSWRESLGDFLRRAGLQVATAGDGGEALDYLDGHSPPDVLLLDTQLLPPCDGPTLVCTLRRKAANAGLKIYGVTGEGPPQFGHAGSDTGIDHWFNTSLNTEELLHDLNQELADVV